MRVAKNNSTATRNLDVPRNLAEWTGERTLLTLALDAAQHVRWSENDLESQKPSPCGPRMLLTLLTYCYASAIYGSQDILQAIQTNRTVRYICAHNYPDWVLLRKFRRSHRSQIEQALRWVFQQAWAQRFDEAEADYLGYEWFEMSLKTTLDSAVQTRLELAILLDGVETD